MILSYNFLHHPPSVYFPSRVSFFYINSFKNDIYLNYSAVSTNTRCIRKWSPFDVRIVQNMYVQCVGKMHRLLMLELLVSLGFSRIMCIKRPFDMCSDVTTQYHISYPVWILFNLSQFKYQNCKACAPKYPTLLLIIFDLNFNNMQFSISNIELRCSGFISSSHSASSMDSSPTCLPACTTRSNGYTTMSQSS
jgi:hypothetical protein